MFRVELGVNLINKETYRSYNVNIITNFLFWSLEVIKKSLTLPPQVNIKERRVLTQLIMHKLFQTSIKLRYRDTYILKQQMPY